MVTGLESAPNLVIMRAVLALAMVTALGLALPLLLVLESVLPMVLMQALVPVASW